MVNKETVKIINTLHQEVDSFGIKIKKDSVIENLKKIRKIALKEEKPRMVKAARLAYEHLETYDGFKIPLLADEPIEGFEDSNLGTESEIEIEDDEDAQKESFLYLLSIMKDPENKNNASELKEYNVLLKNYADIH